MTIFLNWISDNYIELFGAVTGIIYVFLEIRQHVLLWPVGIITSAVYIWVFLTGKLYADMSLQVYYLAISVLGWYWWASRTLKRKPGSNEGNIITYESGSLPVIRLKMRTGVALGIILVALYTIIWFALTRFTDSPVPVWDSFLTSLSIVATWMLARKIYEHWYLWIVVNAGSVILFIIKGLYPTILLYIVYLVMSFAGLKEWKKTIEIPES